MRKPNGSISTRRVLRSKQVENCAWNKLFRRVIWQRTRSYLACRVRKNVVAFVRIGLPSRLFDGSDEGCIRRHKRWSKHMVQRIRVRR